MKRNKIIVEESRINPKKMIVAKYRNRNKFKNREEIMYSNDKEINSFIDQ